MENEPTQPHNPGCRVYVGLLLLACAVLVTLLVVFYLRERAHSQALVGTWDVETALRGTGTSSLTLAADGTYRGIAYLAAGPGAGAPRRTDVGGRWVLDGTRLLLQQDPSLLPSYGYYATNSPAEIDVVAGPAGRRLRYVTQDGRTVTLALRRR